MVRLETPWRPLWRHCNVMYRTGDLHLTQKFLCRGLWRVVHDLLACFGMRAGMLGNQCYMCLCGWRWTMSRDMLCDLIEHFIMSDQRICALNLYQLERLCVLQCTFPWADAKHLQMLSWIGLGKWRAEIHLCSIIGIHTVSLVDFQWTSWYHMSVSGAICPNCLLINIDNTVMMGLGLQTNQGTGSADKIR